ncbi:Unknown protein [Striga hermonthica]|uniref:DUF4283 domain-containing protein n=1 Tax=Striga hermonthica TaxID=68872 RepID=A0A9N7NVR7_STRHE|nr:Unknown protein [Striga hermonthica]
MQLISKLNRQANQTDMLFAKGKVPWKESSVTIHGMVLAAGIFLNSNAHVNVCLTCYRILRGTWSTTTQLLVQSVECFSPGVALEKRANFNGLRATLNMVWSTKQAFEIRSIGQNSFQFIFQNDEDRAKVLQGKTWTFDGQYILLKNWSPEGVDFSEEDEKVQLWVQIHQLPLHWLGYESGIMIGKLIGKVLDVYKCWWRLILKNLCHSERHSLVKKKDVSCNVLRVGQLRDWLRVYFSSWSDSKSSRSNQEDSNPSGDVTKPANPTDIIPYQSKEGSVSANSSGMGEKGSTESERVEEGQGSGSKIGSDCFSWHYGNPGSGSFLQH